MIDLEARRYSVPSVRRPVHVPVERHVIVGRRMEYQVLVDESITGVSAAQQYLQQASCPDHAGVVSEARRVLATQIVALRNLLALIKAESGELDGLCEVAEPGHGAAA